MRKFLFVLIFAFIASPSAFSGENISSEEAVPQVDEHLKKVKSILQEFNDKYDYAHVSQTLEAALSQAGVQQALENAKSWGQNSIFLVWSGVRQNFYNYVSRAFSESRKTIQRQDYATEEDLDELQQGMDAVEQRSELFEQLLQKLLSIYTKLGKLEDEIDAARQEQSKDPNNEAFAQKIKELEKKRKPIGQEINDFREDFQAKQEPVFHPIKPRPRLGVKETPPPPTDCRFKPRENVPDFMSRVRRLQEELKRAPTTQVSGGS